nr:uncharacterized protein LOC117225185 [Megalopta genalis]XP_033334413.1 uncharacterized protein LOC117225185 [Megalopta genalis]
MPPKLRGGKNNEKYETIKKMRPSVEENNVKSNVKSNIVFRKCNQQKIKKHRKNYAPESLEKAVKAVNEGISLRKAAQMHCVPVTSIFRAAKNPTKIRSKCGPPTILTEQEEQDIIQWILYRAERGYPVRKEELLDSVQSYVTKLGRRTPFTHGRPGRHWYEKLCKRHPNITVRTSQNLSMTRASVTEENLRGWFGEIKTYLHSKNLIDIHPSRVYNCDETNVELTPKPDRVLTKKGAHTVYTVLDANEKESFTTLFMYNAEGLRAPPMILYSYKENEPNKILENSPSEWGIGVSENGWMTIETFYEYITNIFYPWLLKTNIEFPIILYLGGHSSLVTIPLFQFCREKRIEIIALYPNATHIIQPLDIAVFHPFKDIWKETLSKWEVENVSKVRKEQFPLVLQKALQSYTAEKMNVQGGFKASGLMPFNPEAVEYNVLHKKKTNNKNYNVQTNQANQVPESQQHLVNKEIENKIRHLETFEKNLSQKLLQNFKEAESAECWINDIENKGLFNYWLQIKKAASGISFGTI